jgi:hypothetical protein
VHITRSFNNQTFEITQNKICSFWEAQGYKVNKISDHKYIGNRGHILHNLYTCDMKKLPTTISIDISEETIDISIQVNTFLQIITKTEGALWDIEFERFDALLKNKKINEEMMSQYHKKIKRFTIGFWSVMFVLVLIITVFIFMLIHFPFLF